MKAFCIDYKDTGNFSNLLLDYVDRHPQLADFITEWPTLPAFGRQIDRKQSFPSAHRQTLVDVLKQQYGSLLVEGSATAINIASLNEPKTFTITTGHQLNLFTGPLYFIFKIAAAIKLSRTLKEQYPEYHFVPVYWMATEDHDFAEINHTFLHGEKIQWDRPALSATGRIPTAGIEATVAKYVSGLGLGGFAKELAFFVQQAYLGESNLAHATRALVHQLFGKEGLVIVDADHTALKQEFAPIMQLDILEQHSFSAITARNEQLAKLGYPVQVNGREINFFHLTDDYRARIIGEKDEFQVFQHSQKWTAQNLKDEIATRPERFSPNVVMRPLYQEVILPNLAYIGGAAEVAYWLQLKGVFDHYQVPYPLLIPRNSAILAERSLIEKIERLGLDFKQIFQATATIQKAYVAKQTAHRLDLSEESQAFETIFAELKARAEKIDPTLGPSTAAVEARLRRALQNLEKKLLKADLRNHQDALQQIERIKEKLFPGGSLQERKENFGLFYVKHGHELIEELIRIFDPLAFKFTVVY